MLVAALVSMASPTANASPGEAVVEQYLCRQTNPMQYASFYLQFRADTGLDPDHPISATLFDTETQTIRMRSTNLVRREAYDLADPDMDAYSFGRDSNDTVYLLVIPTGSLDDVFRAQVTQVFGGGVAQWVNQFECVERQ
jgi:hypothetical protein